MNNNLPLYNKYKVIAIIPARSGSKGLKHKNIRELNGKPLISYSIEAAIKSGVFDTIHVSTDSQEYAKIAAFYGADVPFLRDRNTSGDISSSWDVVREVLTKYHLIGKDFDICVILQPTSPLRTAEDIRNAYTFYIETKAKSLTSVSQVEHPIQWCFTLDKTSYMKDFAKSPYKDCRRQELENYYRENGAIYITTTKDVNSSDFNFYTTECIAYIMDRQKSIDIDTLQDFLVAEALLKTIQEER